MKKYFKIFTSICLAAVISLSAASCAAEPIVNSVSAPPEAEVNVQNVSGVSLLSATPAVVSEDGTVSQTITATVLPMTASNKEVDWSVAWISADDTRDVTEYVTVTPESDGSTTATVTAHQAFENSPVMITVTTRQGGFTAQTYVRYIGVASGLSISSDCEISENGCYLVSSNSEAVFECVFENVFGVVTDEYKENVVIDLNFGLNMGDIKLENVETGEIETKEFMELNFEDFVTVEVTGRFIKVSIADFLNVELTDMASGRTYKYTSACSGLENCSIGFAVFAEDGRVNCRFEISLYIPTEDISVTDSELLF